MYFSPVNLSSSVIQLVPTGNTFQKFQPFPALKGWFKKIDMNISINLPFLLRGHPCFCLDVGVYLTAVLHMWHTIQTLTWYLTQSYVWHIAQTLTWCLTAVLHMWHTKQTLTWYLAQSYVWHIAQTLTWCLTAVLHMWHTIQTLVFDTVLRVTHCPNPDLVS